MRRKIIALIGIASSLFAVVGVRPAFAADTIETWDVGATDLDFYLGVDGIGRPKHERETFADMMLGYGLIKRLSAYFGTTLQCNEYLGDGSGTIYMGMFGTLAETNHFDLDLFLDVRLGGDAFSELQVTPQVELNFDLDPQMRSWGVYLRAGIPIYGQKILASTNSGDLKYRTNIGFATTLGTYWTVSQGHQILLEYDMGIHPKPNTNSETETEIGGVALGYNVRVHDSIELINQIHIDIPQEGEPVAAGIMIGMIATMPSS